ncbi:MAG TPA: SOS response-associated peptidase family protein [Verrucomicrobiae bacterium]|nr:SOS response-associated peptidase family protein [Verrucomicrobiae bacterium]
MCFSAQVRQDLHHYERQFGARIDTPAFERLYRARLIDNKVRIPKALDANWAPGSDIGQLASAYNQSRTRELEAELFKQKRRLGDAERTLQNRSTKAAAESRRIATGKVEGLLSRITDLKRVEAIPDDSRIFPFWYTPALVADGGQLLVRPMRYHCRPAGKPESYDRKYDGLYNARRDNLEGFWKGQFGNSHAVLVLTGFFENVARHDLERRPLAPGETSANVVLHFRPRAGGDMLVAALWSHWESSGRESLDSVALITDDPPAEVAAAGHDRCPVPLKAANVAAWLEPAGAEPGALHALLDDRERPYYEHRLAA